MPSQQAQPVQVSVPRRGLIGLIAGGAALLLLLVAILALLLTQLSALERLNGNVRTTDADLRDLRSDLGPTAATAPSFLRRGRPFFESADDDLGKITRVLPSVEASTAVLASEALPALRAIRAADLPANLDPVPRIDAGLGDIQVRLGALARLERSVDGIGRSVADIRGNTDTLPGIGRSVGGIDRSVDRIERRAAALARIERSVKRIDRRLNALPSIERSARGTRDTLAAVREQIRDIVRDVQEIRERVASIDNKTGGEFPVEPRPDGSRR